MTANFNLLFRENPHRIQHENWVKLRAAPFLWRAWQSAQQGHNNMPFAERVELLVKARLQELGLRVQRTPNNDPFDQWVIRPDNRTIRVEVKGSQGYYVESKYSWRYQAAIRNHQADVYLFVCLTEFNDPHYFIIPRAALANRKNIAIWSRDPRDYAGQWAEYLENWRLLHLAFLNAPILPQQPALF